MTNNTAVLRLLKIQTREENGQPIFNEYNDMYRHIEGTKYKNLRTNKEWNIPDEKAKEIFVIDYNASMLLNKYPLLEELIFKLKLKLDK